MSDGAITGLCPHPVRAAEGLLRSPVPALFPAGGVAFGCLQNLQADYHAGGSDANRLACARTAAETLFQRGRLVAGSDQCQHLPMTKYASASSSPPLIAAAVLTSVGPTAAYLSWATSHLEGYSWAAAIGAGMAGIALSALVFSTLRGFLPDRNLIASRRAFDQAATASVGATALCAIAAALIDGTPAAVVFAVAAGILPHHFLRSEARKRSQSNQG